MAISFIASVEFNSDTDATTYTITDPLPSGLQADDICIMAVACPTPTNGAVVFTGWTLVQQISDAAGLHRASVWYRKILSGDVTTDDFTFDQQGTAEGLAFITSLYRGVDPNTPFIANAAIFSETDVDNSLASPTIHNPDAAAWCVGASFGSDTVTGDATVTMSATGSGWTTTERNDIDGGETTAAHYVGFYDSNGVVAVGDVSMTGTLGSTTTDVDQQTWIGILKPAPTKAGSSLLVYNEAVIGRAHNW